MKHTCFNRVLSALIALVMVIGFLPTGLIPVQTEAHAWNDSATMTLLADGQEVEPASVIETADTKLKVYTIDSDKVYKLTTSADNDYGVLFNINRVQIGEDDYGNAAYDEEADVELDNVTIRTYNPRQDLYTDLFAAMAFRQKENGYCVLNITLTGENTVELLGVKDEVADERWCAVYPGDASANFKGDGSLTAKVSYANTVENVSAMYMVKTTKFIDTVTVNAQAQTGDGFVVENSAITVDEGAKLNVTAGNSGIVYLGESTTCLFIHGQADVKAVECGINWQGYTVELSDGAKLTVSGLEEGAAPVTGILTRRGVNIAANCVVSVDAINEAFSCTASDVTSDYSAPIFIGENSVVTVTGTREFGGFAVDCGIKTAHNSYWAGASYPASTLTLASGAMLTVNSGYRALQALSIDMAEGSAIYVTSTKEYKSNSEYECTPVYISSKDTYIREGATFEIDTVSEYAINGYTKLNFLSDDVYFKCASKVLYSTSFLCGEGIVALQSADGSVWRPTYKESTMAYMTTRKVENHECYNETVTPVEGQASHTMACLYCGKETIMPCEWDYGSWQDTSAGILRFRCKLCKQEKLVNVPYHSHTYENWTPLTGTVNQQHEAFCTYPGCGAGTSGYCSSYYGEEYHVGLTTMRRDCTRCGQYTTRELEDVTTKHVEAKTATCNAPGNVEYWSCGHCNKYFADANCTTELSVLDAFITPCAHTYVGGICAVCGDQPQTLSFWQADGGLYEYDNYNFVIVGKDADGKLYIMGNAQEDGKRVGLQIPASWIDENGILTVSSDYAEFMLWDNMNDGFIVDGGYLSLMDGNLFVYSVENKGDQNVPYPATFSPYDYSDGTGLGYMSAYLSGKYSEREYMVFNTETKTFEVSATEENSLYIYVQLCDHPNMQHIKYAAPTCTEQGSPEYWYCDKCGDYYSNAEGTILMEMPEYGDFSMMTTIAALGHKFGADDKCVNCGMERPVYSKITTLEEYDALSGDAYYLIVFEVGDKTYAAALPPENHYWDDMDGDGEFDLFVIDENANGIPDCIETVDQDENGVLDILEDWDYDEEIGSRDDYMRIYEQLAYAADEAMYSAPNFVEVTKAADGTITLGDEGAMQLQMIPASVWGNQEEYPERSGEFDILDTERIRAMWVPNYWVGAGGQLSLWGPEQFRLQYRCYGDKEYPGMMDLKNWKISFREDGTVCMMDGWSEYDNTAALQFVKYTNDMGEEAFIVFGAPEMEWEYSPVYSTMIETYPAFLYAAEPVGLHTCAWSEWIADDDGQTHTRTCEGCGKTETADHRWNAGEIATEATCEEAGSVIYTCLDCKAVRTEVVEALGHKWVEHEAVEPGCETEGNIAYRQCATCGAAESLGETPVPLGKYGWVLAPTGHAMEHHEAIEPTCTENGHLAFDYCTNCKCFYYEDPLMLTYQAGVILAPGHDYIDHEGQAPTCEEAGWAAYQTCTNCDFTSYEALSATGHKMTEWTHVNINTHTRFCANGCGLTETEDHKWSEWTTDGEKTHTKTCTICGGTRTELHVWNSEVISANTCTADGRVRYTCQFCDETYTTVIPAGHAWSEWEAKPDGSYYRACSGCQAEEWINLPEERPVNNTPADNAASSNLEGSDIELIDQILTQEEQSQVAAGAEVSIYLVVEDISEEVSEEDQEAAAEVMKEDSQVGMYLDINLFKQVEQEQTQVSETNKEVAITIVIPEELRTTAEGIERSYQIIRVHDVGNGVLITDVIEGAYNPEDGTFTFLTDKFSTYALIYTDAEEQIVPGDMNGDGVLTNDDVVAIMWHVLFPELYPLSANTDLNNDGVLTNDDVIALMWHVLFPELYPLG